MKRQLFKNRAIVLAFSLILLITPLSTAYAAENFPVEWDLSGMYADEAAFDEGVAFLSETAVEAMTRYKGNLADDDTLLKCLELYESAQIEATKLVTYASMLEDTDSTNTTYQALRTRAYDASSAFDKASAYLNSALLERSDAELSALAEAPRFKRFSSLILSVAAMRDTALSEESQALLAMMTPLVTAPEEIYSQATLSDARFGQFTNHLGNTRTFDPEWDTVYLYSDSANMRSRAFEALYSPYIDQKNTLAATYIAEVQKNAFQAEANGFGSSLAYALSGTIDVDAYKTLIQAARDNVDAYQGYLRMKKEALGLEELTTSDLLLPYGTDFSKSYPYEDAVKMVTQALKPLGDDYAQKLDAYFKEGLIDVYPADYKTTSQYSWGAYGSPTYVLLNYEKTLADVSTVAHELGHAIHQIYINENQSFFDTQLTPFPAEVTSIYNELQLMDYLRTQTDDAEEQLAYTQNELDFFIQTFFEQVMLADFEMRVHEAVDNGEVLSLDVLNQLFKETAAHYFGEEVTIEPSYETYWMSVPHLYQNHYVYAYAMSLAAAQKIKTITDVDGVSAYLDFLKVGSSQMPLDALADVGVDFTDGAVYDDVFNQMRSLTARIDTALKDPERVLEYPATMITLDEIEDYFTYYNLAGGADGDMREGAFALLFVTMAFAVLLLIGITIGFMLALVSRSKYKKKAQALVEENDYLKAQRLSTPEDRGYDDADWPL